MLPYYPLNRDNEGHHNYNTYTFWDKLVADYSHLSIIEVNKLDFIDYLILRHDAFIDRMSKTEEGQKYLDNAWRLENGTNPNRNKLREMFGKGG